MPAISVIIPVYNIESYVCDCVDSILAQDFKDLEIILVDDDSTDNSYGIIKEKYQNHDNIMILRQVSNGGPGRARNRGLVCSKGKYVYFMDGDDILWGEDAIRSMYELAEKNRADIVHATSYYVPDEENFHWGDEFSARIERKAPYKPEAVRKLPDDINQRLYDAYIQKDSADMVYLNLYRRSFLLENEIFFTNMKAYEDNLFVLSGYTATDRVWILPKTFYVYRQRKGSITHDNSLDRVSSLTESLVAGLRYIECEITKLCSDKNVLNKGALQMAYCKYVLGVFRELCQSHQQKEALVAVIKDSLEPWFPEDTFLATMLLYYFGENKEF